jgi:hypothetical protein
VSSAILAVCAAITALLASHHSDEAILEQMRATDTWSFYQAKSVKLEILSGNIEQATSDGKLIAPERMAKVEEYKKEMVKIKAEGQEMEDSSAAHMVHHVSLARGVTAFQIAIAMGAIAVLARRPRLWFVSLGLGLLGLVFMIVGLL